MKNTPSQSDAPRKILLLYMYRRSLEDDLSGLLTDSGFDVETADGIDSGPTAAEQVPPHLVILNLPENAEDGWEDMTRLARQFSRRIPVIATGCSSDTDYRRRIFSSGVTDYIIRPFPKEEILARIQMHLRLRNREKRLEELAEQRSREQDKTQKTLRENQQRFNDLAANIPGVIYQFYVHNDGTMGVSFATTNALNTFHFPQTEKELLDVLVENMHPDDREPFFCSIREAVTQCCDWRFEGRLRTSRGLKWFQGISKSLPIENGVLFNGVLLDITDRKEAEARLAESEAKYRKLVQNVRNIIIRLDKKGCITFANNYALHYFGFLEHELIGKSIVGTIVPETESTGRNLKEMIQDFIRNPDEYAYNENENILKDGSRVWISWTNSAVFDSEGRIANFFCVGTDITERKNAEMEMMRRKRHLRALLEIQQLLLTADVKEEDWTFILKKLGQIVGVSRVYIFKNQQDPELGLLTSQQFEWCAPGIPSQIENPILQNISFDQMPRWKTVLENNGFISGHIQNFPESERQILNPQGILSILVLPLTSDGVFSGFIGFDDCAEFREWEDMEISLLRSAAAAISMSRDRTEARKKLAGAYHALEEQVEKLSALNHITRSAAAMTDPAETLASVAGEITRIFNARGTVISMFNDDTTALTILAHESRNRKRTGSLIGFSTPVSGIRIIEQIIKERCIVCLGESDIHRLPTPIRDLILSRDITAILNVPLLARGRIFGIIQITDDRPGFIFSEEEIRLAETFAGQVAGIIENTRLLAQARKNEEHYRNLFSNSPAAHLLVDYSQAKRCLEKVMEGEHQDPVSLLEDMPDTADAIRKSIRIADANQAALELFKAESLEELQDCASQIMGCFSPAAFMEQIKSSDAENRMLEHQAVIRNLKNEKIHLLLKEQAISLSGPYDSRNSRHVMISVTDLTRLSRMEKALKRALLLYREHERYKIQELMQQSLEIAVEMTGSRIGFFHLIMPDRETVIPQAWIEEPDVPCGINIIGRHYPLSAAGIWADALRLKKPVICNDYENDPNQKGMPDRHQPVSRFLAVPILEDGKSAAIIAVGNKPEDYSDFDIRQTALMAESIWNLVQRKHADEGLRNAKETAENANRAKSDFLARMSHELKTPLSTITGMSYLALGKQPPPPFAEYLSKIQSAAHLLDEIIGDILDFSSLESRKLRMEQTEFPLNKVIAPVMDELSVKAGAKGIVSRIFVCTETPENLVGDPVRLRQILSHLTRNAVKFTKEGDIRLAVSCIRRETGNPHLRFAVKDTGIGIEADRIPELFEPFTQIDGSSSRKYGGSGLGLTICKRLTAMMGGEIGVESVPEKGSEFFFTVRIGPPANLPEESPSESEAGAGTGTRNPASRGVILLAEDNVFNQEVIIEMLKTGNYQVHTAANGKEAVALFGQSDISFDAVLMDIQMPEMDGHEASRCIREMENSAERIPVIAMTADIFPEVEKKCRESGMDDFIHKPFNLNELFEVLERWVKPGKPPLPQTPEAPSDEALTEKSGDFPTASDALPGVDTASGLERVSGNRELYARLIFQFEETYQDAPEQLRRSLEKGELKTAAGITHSLKSVSGNLGAHELYDALLELENAILQENPDAVSAPLEQFRQIHADLCRHIQALRRHTEPEPASSPSEKIPEEIAEDIQRLYRLLGEDDMEASQCFGRIRKHIDQMDIRETVSEMDTRIRRYEYAEAQEILKAAADRLGIPLNEFPAT